MKYERGWHIESTPTSALDQWELLVQTGLQSEDDTARGSYAGVPAKHWSAKRYARAHKM